MRENGASGGTVSRVAPKIELDPQEREELEKLKRAKTTPKNIAQRVDVVLLAASGLQNEEIARLVGTTPLTVGVWRRRFRLNRMAGLKDRAGRGKKRVYGHDDRLKVIALSSEEREDGTRPTVRGTAARAGMSKTTVGRILKEIDLKPHRTEIWLTSRDPDFEKKAAEICGLYLNPPENALVVSVDEKTQIQALERKFPDKTARPKSPRKRDFEYIRHGTASLFAAFIVETGQVVASVKERHTRVEFLEFLDELDRACPGDRIVHVILDNLAVHKTQEVKDWIGRHFRFQLHFTPTHASWLNQVELFFSILSRRYLRDALVASREELVEGMMGFIRRYNEEARPFRWVHDSDPLRI